MYTLATGERLYQSNAIVRYIGKIYRGPKGETLYPPNAHPMLMHACDEYLEMASELLEKYASFVVPVAPKFSEKDTLLPEFLANFLPGFLQKIEDRLYKSGSAYLVTAHVTVADLVMFAQFWRMIYNPHTDWPVEQVLDIFSSYPRTKQWLDQMNNDTVLAQKKLIAKIKLPY